MEETKQKRRRVQIIDELDHDRNLDLLDIPTDNGWKRGDEGIKVLFVGEPGKGKSEFPLSSMHVPLTPELKKLLDETDEKER